MRDETINACAAACLLGLPGWRIMESEDPLEVLVLQAVTQAAMEQSRNHDRNRAVEIANAVGTMLKNAFRKRGK